MDYNGDLFKIMGEENPRGPESPAMLGDYFDRGTVIPQSAGEEENSPAAEAAANPFSDWRLYIDRELMKGGTAAQIEASDGFLGILSGLEDKKAPLAYLRKYEGLMGTIFIDSKVLANGFPIVMIPRQYKPFHMYAVNCDDVICETRRSIRGGVGGDIDDFLNSADELEEEKIEICARTRLPVLKEGMFTREVISGILDKLGEKGDTLAELREAMKRKVLKIDDGVRTVVEDDADYLRFHLKRQAPDLKMDGKPEERREMPPEDVEARGVPETFDIRKPSASFLPPPDMGNEGDRMEFGFDAETFSMDVDGKPADMEIGIEPPMAGRPAVLVKFEDSASDAMKVDFEKRDDGLPDIPDLHLDGKLRFTPDTGRR